MSQVQLNDLRGSKQREFNVVDFGAKGDGTTVDTAAIQRAIDAAEAIGGGLVKFPKGNYKISALTVTVAGVYLVGAGMHATKLTTTATSGSVVSFVTPGSGGGIRDLSIEGAAGSATEIGLNIDSGSSVTPSEDFVVENIRINGCANGMRVDQQLTAFYRNIHISGVKPTTGIGIDVGAGHSRFMRDIEIYNATGSEGAAGILFRGGTIGDLVENVSLLGQIDGLVFSPTVTAPAYPGSYSIWSHFTDVYCDSMTRYGVNISPIASTDVSTIVFTNLWTSNVETGVLIAGAGTVHNIQIVGGRLRGATKHGVSIDGSAGSGFDGFTFNNVQVASNSTSSSGTYHGIYLKSCSRIVVTGSVLGELTSETQGYGIYVDSGVTYVNIAGNAFYGNVTGDVRDAGAITAFNTFPNATQYGQVTRGNTDVNLLSIHQAKNNGGSSAIFPVLDDRGFLGNNSGQVLQLRAYDAAGTNTYKLINGQINTGGGLVDVFDVYKDGHISQYNGEATAGAGVGYVRASVALTGQTAAITSTNLLATAAAGLYRVSAYLHTTTAAGGPSTSNVTLGWTYNGGAKSLTLINAHDQNSDENSSQASAILRSDAASAIAFAVTVSALTPTYAIYITVERLQ